MYLIDLATSLDEYSRFHFRLQELEWTHQLADEAYEYQIAPSLLNVQESLDPWDQTSLQQAVQVSHEFHHPKIIQHHNIYLNNFFIKNAKKKNEKWIKLRQLHQKKKKVLKRVILSIWYISLTKRLIIKNLILAFDMMTTRRTSSN